jgi:hypothetical protein
MIPSHPKPSPEETLNKPTEEPKPTEERKTEPTEEESDEDREERYRKGPTAFSA